MSEKFEMVPVNKISLAAYNPRVMSKEVMARLKSGLSEFGLVQPMVINQDGTLIGGHQRLKATIELIAGGKVPAGVEAKPGGEILVPCVRVNLDKREEKALNLALNKISGEWDFPKLTDLLTEIGGFEGFDVELTGFEAGEFGDLNGFDSLSTFGAGAGIGPAAGGTSSPSGAPAPTPPGQSVLDAYKEEYESNKSSKLNPAKVLIVSVGGYIHGLPGDAFENRQDMEDLMELEKDFAANADEVDKAVLGVELGKFALAKMREWKGQA